jgi:hypothetical protein
MPYERYNDDLKITTEDGKEVGVGDWVFNYYDGRWGRIEHINSLAEPDPKKGQNSSTPLEEWSNHWFTLDNGDFLDGSRIATYDPKGTTHP